MAQVHQVRALMRDEGNLRKALKHDEELRYDRDTAVELRDRLDDLLESITAIARDDELWRKLADAADEPLSDEHFDTFADLAAGDLARLLEVFGYHCPPPPPVDELVDSTVEALGAARIATGDRRVLIQDARWHLITFGLRVGRQIELAPPAAGPSTVRRLARRAGSVARQLAPVALAAAVGVMTGTALAGVVPAILVKAAEKVSEHGVKIATEALVGSSAYHQAGDSSGAKESGVLPTYRDPLELHVGALFGALGKIRSDVGLAGRVLDDAKVGTMVIETYGRHLARFRRHVRRVGDLLEARQLQSPRLSGALHSIDQAIDKAFEAGNCLYRNPCGVSDAAETLESAVRELHDALDGVPHGKPREEKDDDSLAW